MRTTDTGSTTQSTSRSPRISAGRRCFGSCFGTAAEWSIERRQKVDDAEDGGRGRVVEEAIVADSLHLRRGPRIPGRGTSHRPQTAPAHHENDPQSRGLGPVGLGVEPSAAQWLRGLATVAGVQQAGASSAIWDAAVWSLNRTPIRLVDRR